MRGRAPSSQSYRLGGPSCRATIVPGISLQSVMAEFAPLVNTKTVSRWQRLRAGRVHFLVLVVVGLLYLTYSSEWLRGGPPILRPFYENQTVATNSSRSNKTMPGPTTPNRSLTSTPNRSITSTPKPNRTNTTPINKTTTNITPGKTTSSRSATTVTPTRHQTTSGSGHTKTYSVHASGRGGRIGNQMFEYASAYGIARMNNRSAVTHKTKFNTLWTLFTNLSVPRSGPLPNMKTMKPGSYAAYDPKFEKLPESNVKLYGYFQSWKFFQKYERDLRAQFVFREAIRSKASEYFVNIAQTHKNNSSDKNITFVGVHVRRGDMVNLPRYRVASKSYIVKAMDAFRRNFTRVQFVVCSDDIPWCKKNLGNQKNVSFSEKRSSNVDFAILSLCNHTLATVGTYSWWAGWMAGGVTTYYTRFADPSTTLFTTLKFEDYFLPKWIPMSD